jgi:acetyl-CoA carboxylase beta subunit
MAIFDKCPECGENAVVQPELGKENYRIFKCNNGHKFKKEFNNKSLSDEKDIMEHMPEWARKLHELEEKSKERSFQG